MLFLLAPLMALISLLIKLDSPGTIFYRQERLGKNGRPFHL
ncbi:MAG: sugar transferase, partial [Syntrophales bacterium LBB04]|nr:sugar transferase [Syntrophales bacterium LBB04]